MLMLVVGASLATMMTTILVAKRGKSMKTGSLSMGRLHLGGRKKKKKSWRKKFLLFV